MKLINNLKFIVFCLGCAFLFTACEEDLFPATQSDDTLFNIGGALPSLLNPSPGFFNLTDLEGTANSFNTAIAGESASSGDLMVAYSGALGEIGPVSLGSVGIPAEINVSLVEAATALGINLDDIAIGDAFNITLNASTSSGSYVSPAQTIFASCPSALEGEYTVTTTYGYHDFLPDYAENTMDMTITKLASGAYTATDFSGGLYGTGPYNGAYNTGPLSEVEFLEVCGDIVWSDQADPWGALVMTEGGVNSVDQATGVITISWTALGYGENGVTVYTPK